MTKQIFPYFHTLYLPIFSSLAAHFVHWIEKRFHNLWPNDLSAQRPLCLQESTSCYAGRDAYWDYDAGDETSSEALETSTTWSSLIPWARTSLGLFASLGLFTLFYFSLVFSYMTTCFCRGEYVLRARSAIGQSWGIAERMYVPEPKPMKLLARNLWAEKIWTLYSSNA